MVAFICIVVLYNKKMNESKTITKLFCLKDKYNLQIKVVDNSTLSDLSEYNFFYARNYGIDYISMEGNTGLSKAYNAVLEKVLKETSNLDDFIIWFDDDTLIQEEYFNVLQKEQARTNYDIYVPIVVGQDGIVWSPNIAGFLKNKLIHDKYALLNGKNFNAINSCMAVRLRIYKNYRYDERLFLDQVDHKFFSDQRERNKSFGILNVRVVQSFSQRSDNLDTSIMYKRLKIRFKDIMVYGLKANIIYFWLL